MLLDPFWWLRLLLVAAITLASWLFGIEPGVDPTTASVRDLFAALVETTGQGLEERGELDGLAEIVDEPLDEDEIEDGSLEEIVDEPLVDLPPEDGGAENDGAPGGGVVGGGVSDDPSAAESPVAQPNQPTEPPAPTATAPPPSPTATAVATATRSPTRTPVPTSTPRPTATPTNTPAPTSTPAPTATATPDPALLRLDDPVLRWLPELRAASQLTGVPLSLLAALVQVESGGDPNPIGVDGDRGLTGVPGDILAAQGVAPELWHDPATNVLSGAAWLASLFAQTGNWDAALRLAWGPDCDALGQCAGLYAYAVLAWEPHYAAILANPARLPALPPDWAPQIAPYQEGAVRPVPLPPGVPAPTPTATPEPPPTETPVPTETPIPTATTEEFTSAASPSTG